MQWTKNWNTQIHTWSVYKNLLTVIQKTIYINLNEVVKVIYNLEFKICNMITIMIMLYKKPFTFTYEVTEILFDRVWIWVFQFFVHCSAI